MRTQQFNIPQAQPNLEGLAFDPVLWLAANTSEGKNILALGKAAGYWCNTVKGAMGLLKHATYGRDNWTFGYMSYDLKNSIEKLGSANFDGLNFPLFHFWQPRIVLEWTDTLVTVHSDRLSDAEAQQLVSSIFKASQAVALPQPSLTLHPRLSKEEYLHAVEQIQAHIRRGNIYEINFCQEFFADHILLDPWHLFQHLNARTQAPYAAYLRDGEYYALCASPEQFIRKEGNHLCSSPIKGTARRDPDPGTDRKIAEELKNSPKEQAENVMIVDLVRNDLSRIALPGTVKVDALMEVHSFRTVHQLISTVSCQLRPGTGFAEIIRATFPMGSMTGAPKISAMQIAEELETTKRGLYSGSIGYIRPGGDLEFNVVIRTLLYNSSKKYLSLMTGGAITARSIPEEEYQESLLKAEALMKALKF